MTISSQTRTAGPFAGNDATTEFPFTFKVFQTSDLLVVQADADGVETELVLNTDYTATLNANQDSNPGGTVTLATALPTGEVLVVTSEITYTQGVNITNQGGFYPAVINGALDRLTILTQQLKGEVDRSAKLPITNEADAASLVSDIVLLAGISTDLETVAGISADVTTVAGISADVTTVAGTSADVTAVAGINANVTLVADNITNINAVAGNVTNINTVAGDSAAINTVAGDTAAINMVAGDTAAINTVAGDTAAINAVAGDTLAINAVNANTTNINTVAGDTAAINMVAGDSAAINAVAGDILVINAVNANATNINTVAGDTAAINTVAGDTLAINTVAGDTAAINTTAGDSAAINTTAGDSAAINMVAGDSAAINAVAGDTAAINTVAGDTAAINTVAGDSAAINTAADNIAAILAAPTYVTAAANSALAAQAAAQAAALSATDSTARIAAVLKTRGITNIKAITFKSAEGWEKQGNQSYKNETRPTGRFLGDYANVAAAWAANVGDVASVDGDVYWDTTDKAQYELSGGSSRTINYRFGEHFPAEALIVLAGSEGSIRLIVFDMTDPLIPAYIIYAVASGSFLIGTGSAVVSDMVYDDGRVVYGISSVAGRGLRIIDYKNDRASWYLESTTYITTDILSGVRYPDWKFVGSGLSGSPSAALIKSIATHNGYIAAATAEGIAVIKPDGTVVKSSSTSPFLRVAILNGLLFAILDSSPDIVAGYGPVDSLGASFNANVSWTNATTPSLSATSFVGLQGSKDSLVVMSTSTHDILWPNPADYQSSLIARRGLYHATPPMKKPQCMLICSTVTGAVSGDELVTNGGFDSDTAWTKGAGWSIGSGVATHTPGTATNLSQPVAFSANVSYMVQITVSGATAGNLGIFFIGGTNVSSTPAPTNGTHNVLITALTGNVTLELRASSTFDGAIDNVSIKRVIQDFSGLANHGTIHGTLTAAAEVTGGVAGLSGFDSSADYIDCANPWDGIGSDEGWFAFAFKCAPNTLSNQLMQIAYYSGSYSDAAFDFFIETSGLFRMRASSNGYSTQVIGTSTSAYDDSLVHTGVIRKTAAEYLCSLDDSEVIALAVGSHGNLSFNAAATMLIGKTASDSNSAPNSTLWFVGAGQSALSDAEVSLMHKHMRDLITGKAALDEIPTAAAYNEQTGAVELLGATYRQTLVDGAITASVAHGQGSTPAVATGSRGEIGMGGSTGLSVSVPERNLREAPIELKRVERTFRFVADGTETDFPASLSAMPEMSGYKIFTVLLNGVELDEDDGDFEILQGSSVDDLEFARFGTAPDNTYVVKIKGYRYE